MCGSPRVLACVMLHVLCCLDLRGTWRRVPGAGSGSELTSSSRGRGYRLATPMDTAAPKGAVSLGECVEPIATSRPPGGMEAARAGQRTVALDRTSSRAHLCDCGAVPGSVRLAACLCCLSEGGLLGGTPARHTEQVAGIVCLFTWRGLPASPLLPCESAGMPGASMSPGHRPRARRPQSSNVRL